LRKIFALGRQALLRSRTDVHAGGAGGRKKLLRAAQDVPGLLRQDRERLARMPREMRRVSAVLPRERLLGEQIRVEGMRLRQAVARLFERPKALVHRLVRRDPFEARELMARPSELPLGVMAGVELRALRRVLEREPAL
jgi:hypothetical protein